MTKQKIIEVGFIAKKAGTLILTVHKIREELEGQRRWPLLLKNFVTCHCARCL